jgi:Sec7-like guanine-nucleotide exchange factor
MEKAASKFNIKPKNGLKFLMDKGYLPSESGEVQFKAISKFLKTTQALSATSIGEFLGEDKELNKGVLSAFVDELDFTSKDMGFVEALKLMLSGFRLPGEG